MRIRYNLIFIPILIVAALAVWFLGFREKKVQVAKRLSDRALVNVGDVDVIELIRPDQTIRMEKSGDQWSITAPFQVEADPETVGKFVDAIFKAESTRDLSGVTPEQLKEYGLDNPDLKIRLASKAGGVLMDLALGKTNPQGTDRYAVLGANNSICYLIPIYFVTPLNLTASDLRDKRAVTFDPATLVSLQLSSAVADIQFAKRDGTWYVTSPETFPASPTRMDILFENMGQLQAVEFLDKDAANPELKTNKVKLDWRASDGSSGSLTLHGENYARGIFATSSSQPTPFIVEAYIYDRLALDPKVFFHVLLINLPAEQIKRLYIRQPSAQNLEIERTGTGGEDWRILRPAGRTYTDRGDFNRLIQALLAIQPAKTVPAPARAEDYGFEPVYFMKIEVYGAGQDPQSVIYLGKRDEAGDYYATQIGQAYFMISKDLVAAFIATVDKLRGPSPGT